MVEKKKRRFKPIHIIWSKLGKTPPKVVHMDYDKAVNVAKHMAEKHPGQRFFVMASTDSFKVEYQNTPVKRREYPDSKMAKQFAALDDKFAALQLSLGEEIEKIELLGEYHLGEYQQ